jgi:hypothetical protein
MVGEPIESCFRFARHLADRRASEVREGELWQFAPDAGQEARDKMNSWCITQ